MKRFDASAVVHTCSSSRRTPDPLPCWPFPRSLPTPALDENDTAAVWALRLPGEPGGPTSITSTARSTLTTFYIATSSLSGHTSQTCFSVRDVDHHRLLGDRGAEPLDLLPRRGHRRLLPGLTRPTRHRRSQRVQRALLGDPADVNHRRTVHPPPLGRLPLRRLPVNTCRYSCRTSRSAPTAADAAPDCSDPLPCCPTSSIDDLAGIDLAGWVFPRKVLLTKSGAKQVRRPVRPIRRGDTAVSRTCRRRSPRWIAVRAWRRSWRCRRTRRAGQVDRSRRG